MPKSRQSVMVQWQRRGSAARVTSTPPFVPPRAPISTKCPEQYPRTWPPCYSASRSVPPPAPAVVAPRSSIPPDQYQRSSPAVPQIVHVSTVADPAVPHNHHKN
eukprot:3259978-Rhodomonas_salina.3